MKDQLEQEMNKVHTENGALTHDSAKSKVLDLFAMGGALRSRDEQSIEDLFKQAYNENPELALKTLFYIRDIREGVGERRTFRIITQWLAKNEPDVMRKFLSLFAEYGRWDDLLVLLDHPTPLQMDVLKIVQTQLEEDKNTDTPSLLAKWMPSENTSSNETRIRARNIMSSLGLPPKEYRKLLSSLRKKIKIVEQQMSAKEWDKIEFGKVPSKAMLQYRSAFYRNAPNRFAEYMNNVSKGTEKINTSVTYPHEIIRKIAPNGLFGYIERPSDLQALETMWNNLPNYVEDENSIAVVDVSGSMFGTPITVSVGLGLYFAERNKGPFKDSFITFSARPRLQEIRGNDLQEKVSNMIRTDWDMNTNIKAVFDLILQTIQKHNVPEEDQIDRLYIISDMEFDVCNGRFNETVMETIEREYQEADVKLPELVFWNVDSRQNNLPITKHKTGAVLVSGFSPVILKYVMQKEIVSPYQLMLDVLNKERYAPITLT